MLTKLSKTYLGLTVIAMGNALPDVITTITLA
jgi:Ca2+/Na+ antiporter